MVYLPCMLCCVHNVAYEWTDRRDGQRRLIASGATTPSEMPGEILAGQNKPTVIGPARARHTGF